MGLSTEPFAQGSIREVLASARAFLINQQDVKGRWQDFDTLAGESKEWVSAYVGATLADSGDKESIKAANKAWKFLARSRWWQAGWGYSAHVPVDADSTAWGLLLAERLGKSKSRTAKKAGKTLLKHLGENGGIKTYRSAGPIRLFTGLAKKISFSGWCKEHLCVTASTLQLSNNLPHSTMLSYLKAQQNEDGFWDAYWWSDPEYATAFAIQAIVKFEPVEDPNLKFALQWCLQQGLRDANPFQLALRLKVLTPFAQNAPAQAMIHQILDRLTALQKPDGSWAASACLRIPPPDVEDPKKFKNWVLGGRGSGSLVRDHRAIFTTATVVECLNYHQQHAPHENIKILPERVGSAI